MDPNKVGNAIAYLRKRAGFTQKDLADRIGISDKAVSKWERGLSLPDISYLRKLSILLDTDSDSLLAGDVVHHDSGWQGLLVLDDTACGVNAATVIYDKPLAFFLLSYYALVGIRSVTVICSPEEKTRMTAVAGDGSEYGLSLRYFTGSMKDFADQEAPRPGNIMMIYGRCLLYGVDQTRFFQKAMIDKDRLCVLAFPRKEGAWERSVEVDEEKKIVSGGSEERLRTQYDYSRIPVVFFPHDLLGELAAGESVDAYLEKKAAGGELYVELLDRGFVGMEIDDWDSVQEAAAFMRIIQKNCGMIVYCLEEVAWRRGMISAAQLRVLGEKHGDTPYGRYIISLCDRIEENT